MEIGSEIFIDICEVFAMEMLMLMLMEHIEGLYTVVDSNRT